MVNGRKHDLHTSLIPLFLCSEWRCAQPKDSVALPCKHLKSYCSDSLLRDGRMLLLIHLLHCVVSVQSGEWKVCYNYSGKLPNSEWVSVAGSGLEQKTHAESTSYMPRGINIQCYQNYMSPKLKETILWLPAVLNPT